MTTMSHRAMTRVVCRIFIKASPQAVWDAICPALKQSGRYVSLAGNGAAPAAALPGDHAASAQHLSGLITIAETLEADPPGRLAGAVDGAGRNSSVRSGLVYFELRDTLTGYTAVTVSCEAAGAPCGPEPGTVGAHEWDWLLGDLKIVLEAEGRERQRTGPARSSPRRPPRLRPKLFPQVQA